MEHQNPDLSNARVGVIGGSGLYAIAGLKMNKSLPLRRLLAFHPIDSALDD